MRKPIRQLGHRWRRWSRERCYARVVHAGADRIVLSRRRKGQHLELDQALVHSVFYLLLAARKRRAASFYLDEDHLPKLFIVKAVEHNEVHGRPNEAGVLRVVRELRVKWYDLLGDFTYRYDAAAVYCIFPNLFFLRFRPFFKSNCSVSLRDFFVLVGEGLQFAVAKRFVLLSNSRRKLGFQTKELEDNNDQS